MIVQRKQWINDTSPGAIITSEWAEEVLKNIAYYEGSVLLSANNMYTVFVEMHNSPFTNHNEYVVAIYYITEGVASGAVVTNKSRDSFVITAPNANDDIFIYFRVYKI